MTNAVIANTATATAALWRIAQGADPLALVHLTREGVSTPLPAGSSLAGCTERYYTLRDLAFGREGFQNLGGGDGVITVTAAGVPINMGTCLKSQEPEANNPEWMNFIEAAVSAAFEVPYDEENDEHAEAFRRVAAAVNQYAAEYAAECWKS